MLKKIVIGLVAVVVALVGGAYLLPGQVHVERSIVVDAGPEKIFPQINSLKAVNGWAPWLKRDPAAKVDYSGPEAGLGAKVIWQSEVDEVGSGAQEIIESVTDSRVRTALDFGDKGGAEAELSLDPQGGGTRVTWEFDSELGMNPMMRYMGLMFDGWIGADYEAGLANLKALVEQGG